MKVYVTDCGQHMEEDDFMQYLRFLKNTKMKELTIEQFINAIWGNDFFGDSIINEKFFLVMKTKFKNYYNASLSACDQK